MHLRLQQLELVLAGRKDLGEQGAPDVSLLPSAHGGTDPCEAACSADQDENEVEELGLDGAWRSADNEGLGFEEPDLSEATEPLEVRAKFSSVSSRLCAFLPEYSSLEDYVTIPTQGFRRCAEVRYAQGYMTCFLKTFPAASESIPKLVIPAVGLSQATVAELSLVSEQQHKFFKDVDAYVADLPGASVPAQSRTSLPVGLLSAPSWDCQLSRAIKSLPVLVPSPFIVVQAALFLIEQKLFVTPDTDLVNVKQARAFLHIASWLQARMMEEWKYWGELVATSLTEVSGPCVSTVQWVGDL